MFNPFLARIRSSSFWVNILHNFCSLPSFSSGERSGSSVKNSNESAKVFATGLPVIGCQGQPKMGLGSSETILYPWWANYLKICLKLQIPYYHPLTRQSLVGNGNQGQPMRKLKFLKAGKSTFTEWGSRFRWTGCWPTCFSLLMTQIWLKQLESFVLTCQLTLQKILVSLYSPQVHQLLHL